ncbi:MAG: dihydrolipoyl dehydrogenase [Acidobacteriota bacterium]
MYDIIFLGGGPAGYEGALSASKRGLKTGVIEKELPGGTCLHRGCIPTKSLLNSVKIIKNLKTAKKLGVKIEGYEIDIPGMLKQKERVVSKLTRGIDHLFAENGVDMIKGTGKVIAPGVIEVDGSDKYEARNIIISTGSSPAELPHLKFDDEFIISSDKALLIEDVPEKLLVIGAGAIGVEMGVIYSYLGSEVTIVEIMDQIIPGSDRELSDMLAGELRKSRIKVLTSTSVSDPSINNATGKITFKVKDDKGEHEEEYSRALLSVGRKPNSSDIFSSDIGIELDKKGFIVTGKNLKTGAEGIYACGDVIGHPLLAHKASHQAIAIVDFILDGKDIHEMVVPGAVFTFPELASVGITEEEAKTKGIDYKAGRFPYSAGSRSNAVEEKTGMVKVISDENNILLGAHILGAEAGELLPLLTYAVSKKLKVTEFRDLVFIHPTLSENVWEALGEAGGYSIHI